MKNQQEIIEKLSKYGVDPARQGQRSLQEKIIQMYELLELKTTQNLLLRKQNDDVKLQINTINELFSSVLNSPQNLSFQEQSALLDSCTINQNEQQNYQVNKLSQKIPPTNFEQINTQRPIKRDSFSKKYFESSQTSEQSSVQTQSKTPRYPPKPQHNIKSSFNGYDKQQTSRVIPQKSSHQIDQNLNEKIELLMKQNEIILKRMNQIEVNFISTTQQQNSKLHHKNTLDDRSTNISAKIPSITKIPAKRESSSITSYNKAHYSTSNLRSYCPSIE